MANRKEIDCHVLAGEIEWIHARELARRGRGGGFRSQDWTFFYDQHAATELGNLIYNRLFTGETEAK